MKTSTLLLFCVFTATVSAQDTPISAFLEKWENSKDYLLKIAESMPENKYDYKPTERQMSFRAQLIHIKGNIDWLGSTYFNSEKQDKASETVSKEELIKALKKSFAAVATVIQKVDKTELKTTVDFFAGPKTKLQILNLLQDHLTHHRGQLIVYLNLNNIEPPRYSGW